MPFVPKCSRHRRNGIAKQAARKQEELAAADEDVTHMDVDNEPGSAIEQASGGESLGAMNAGTADESALIQTAAPTNAGNTTATTTAPPSTDPTKPNDPFNMAEIRRALQAVQQQTTRENLDALMAAADNDVGTLLELATNGQFDQQATNVLVAAAIFRNHQFVETSWDDTFNHRAEMNQVLLTQLAHLRTISRRVAAYDACPPVSPATSASPSAPSPAAFTAPPPAGNSPFAASTLANLSARVAALEAMVERQEELLFAIRRHGSQWAAADHNGGDHMAAVFERIRQLSRLREDAEAARFERADEEREGKVAELDDKQDEMEEAFERLKEERKEDAHRFRQMRNLLVALSDGDITMAELGDRVRALDMHE